MHDIYLGATDKGNPCLNMSPTITSLYVDPHPLIDREVCNTTGHKLAVTRFCSHWHVCTHTVHLQTYVHLYGNADVQEKNYLAKSPQSVVV